MLLTDSDAIADRARSMRLHGISRDAWRRYTASGSWYYEIEDVGFKYNLTDLAAAIGLAQLERAESMRVARERIAMRYASGLSESGLTDQIELPVFAARGDVHAWHLFPIRIRDGTPERRAAVIEDLRDQGIGTSVHFIPLHMHPYYGRTYGYAPGDLPIARAAYESEVSLPIYPDLADAEVDRVIAALSQSLR
jgi:perosamine synthetase